MRNSEELLGEDFVPDFFDVVAEDDCVLPDVREAAQVVADGGALLGHNPEFVVRAWACEPVLEGLADERAAVQVFGRKVALAIGDRNHAVVAVEGAHVPEVRLLEDRDVGFVKEAGDVVLRDKVLDDGRVREVVVHAGCLACGFEDSGHNGGGFFRSLGAGVAVDFKVDQGVLFFRLRHQGDRQSDGLVGWRVMVGELAIDRAVVDGHERGDFWGELLDPSGVERPAEPQAVFLDQLLDLREIGRAAVALEAGIPDQRQMGAQALLGGGIAFVEERPVVDVDFQGWGGGHSGDFVFRIRRRRCGFSQRPCLPTSCGRLGSWVAGRRGSIRRRRGFCVGRGIRGGALRG